MNETNASFKKIEESVQLPEELKYALESVEVEFAYYIERGGQRECTAKLRKVLKSHVMIPQFDLQGVPVTTVYSENLENRQLLTNLEIPCGIKRICDEAFSYCENLKTVTISDSVTGIGQHVFLECKRLEEVKLPQGLDCLHKGIFSKCEALSHLVLPENLKIIGDSAFYKCTRLTTVDLPSTLETIDDCAFESCTSLVSITIPKSVKSFGGGVFVGCRALREIRFEGTKAQWKKIRSNDCYFGKEQYPKPPVSKVICSNGTKLYRPRESLISKLLQAAWIIPSIPLIVWFGLVKWIEKIIQIFKKE